MKLLWFYFLLTILLLGSNKVVALEKKPEKTKESRHIFLRRSHIKGSVKKPIQIPLIEKQPYMYLGRNNEAIVRKGLSSGKKGVLENPMAPVK